MERFVSRIFADVEAGHQKRYAGKMEMDVNLVKSTPGFSSQFGLQLSLPSDVILEKCPSRERVLENEYLLGEICRRAHFPDRFRNLPFISKRWKRVVQDAHYWTEVEIESWVEELIWFKCSWEIDGWLDSFTEDFVKHAVDLSRGSMTKFVGSHLNQVAIDYLARHCPLLSHLAINNSPCLYDAGMMQIADNCPRLVYFAANDSYNVGPEGLEKLTMRCTRLRFLFLNMFRGQDYDDAMVTDDKALIISRRCTRLKKLGLANTCLSNQGLKRILKGCRRLEYLNLWECELYKEILDSAMIFCPGLKSKQFIRTYD